MDVVEVEEHSDACEAAGLTSACFCGCNGARHAEATAARRLRDRRAQVASAVPDTDTTEPATRPNMRVTEAVPTPARLAAMTDGEVAALFTRFSVENNWDAVAAIGDDLDRRDRDRAWLTNPDADDHWNTGGEPTEQDRQMDVLLAKGYDFADAFEEIYGNPGDADRIRREERNTTVDRRQGESVDAAVRRAYDADVYDRWLRAETDLRGHLLNPRGRAAGIDPLTLFSGTAQRARAYASEDLMRWWTDNGRVTFTEFRADTLGRGRDRRAAELTRVGGNGRDWI
jgi:hypothetical protein